MPLKLADAAVYLTTDDKGLKEGLGKAEGTVESGASRMGGVFKNALGTALGVGIFNVAQSAFQGLTGMIADGIGDAREATKIQQQLAQVIESTGGAAGMTVESINALATSLSNVSNFEDDAIVAGENMLLTFTNIGQDVFPQATQTMLDMSQALGTDLQGSAMQLGKALNDPVKGIGALSRVGVSFTEQQKEMIKAMVAAGDTAGAQQVILAELAKEFGGQAAAQADPLIQLQNAWGNLKETLGGAVLPIFNQLAQSVLPYVQTAITQVGAAVTMFFDFLNNGFGILGSFQIALFNVFGDNAITRAISTLIDYVKDLKNVFMQVFGLWVSYEDDPPWVTMVVEGAKQIKELITQIGEMILKFVSWKDIAIVVGAALASVVVPAIAGVIAAAAPVVAAVAAIIAIVALLRNAWESDFGGIQGKTSAVLAYVQEWFDRVLPYIQTLVSTVLGAIQGFWEAHGSAIMTVVQNTWNTIWTIIDTVIKTILDLVTLTLQVLTGDWEGAGETLKGIVTRIWEGVKSIFGDTLDSIVTLFGDFDWAALGENIMLGIKDGILAGVRWIIDAARDAADSAYEAAQHALGISSPSKVAAEGIGKPFAQGIGVGMRDELARMQSGFASGFNGLVNGLAGAAQPAAGAPISIAITVNGGGPGVGEQVRGGVLDALRQVGLR